VIEAVREGKFRIHAIEHVEDGVEILTGMPAGKEGPDGRYPAGALNRLVEERLTALREAMKGEEEGEKRKEGEE
ncbi:MAG TPA: hypothetical protein VFF01_02870, partial [Candidatus Deferrimicrobiaceae bacterium]|nr:hypothetical protein [Candidatus Deferrimicrobiaceae bacterium]